MYEKYYETKMRKNKARVSEPTHAIKHSVEVLANLMRQQMKIKSHRKERTKTICTYTYITFNKAI